MEHDEGDLAAAALFTAASNMFAFLLAALKMALKQERMAGFTEDGRQVEPPIAHLVRPALEAFLAKHQTVGSELELTPKQAAVANQAYQGHVRELRDRILGVLVEFET